MDWETICTYSPEIEPQTHFTVLFVSPHPNKSSIFFVTQVSIENQSKKVIFNSILKWLFYSSPSELSSTTTSQSVTLDSLLTIQSVRVKTLPPPQNGQQLVSTQDWGKIQSQLFECKWSCICVLLEARRRKDDDFDAVAIGEMCVRDLGMVSRNDHLPIMKCATMIMEQVSVLQLLTS